jgi:hypothetical protein
LNARVEHVRFSQLLGQAAADVGDHRAQKDEMPQRSARGDQRDGISGVRVSDQHNVVVAVIERRTHDVGIGIEGRGAVLERQIHRHHGMTGLLQ